MKSQKNIPQGHGPLLPRYGSGRNRPVLHAWNAGLSTFDWLERVCAPQPAVEIMRGCDGHQGSGGIVAGLSSPGLGSVRPPRLPCR